MRLPLIIAGFSAMALYGAHATPALERSCISVGHGYERVAATVARPADCCTGRLQCSQFLSTTRVVRPAHDQHT